MVCDLKSRSISIVGHSRFVKYKINIIELLSWCVHVLIDDS